MMKYPTTRWYTIGIALLVIVTYANAEQPKIGKAIDIEMQELKDIRKPTIIPKPNSQTNIQKPTPQANIQKLSPQKIQTNDNLRQRYTATFSQQLEHSGTLTISNISWQCNRIQKQCVTFEITKTLGMKMQACQKLVSHQNQKLRTFGSQRDRFNFSQINQCNTTVQAAAKPQTPIKTVNQNATYKASMPNTKIISINPADGEESHTSAHGVSKTINGVKLSKFNDLSNKIKQKTTLDLEGARLNAYGGHGRRFSGNDCNDDRRDANPNATEVCDHIDNDCDGLIDEGQTTPYYLDADGDNHGDPSRRVDVCPSDVTDAANNGAWLVRVGNDCDDTDPAKWNNCS